MSEETNENGSKESPAEKKKSTGSRTGKADSKANKSVAKGAKTTAAPSDKELDEAVKPAAPEMPGSDANPRPQDRFPESEGKLSGPDTAQTPAPEVKAVPPATKEAPAKAAAPATPPVAAKAAEPAAPPEPPPAGEFGKLLEKAGFKSKPLGNDAMGTEMVEFTTADVLRAGEFLRDDASCKFDLMLSCTGIDWKDRLESVYHLYSTTTHKYLAFKVTAENEHSPSLCPVWPAANWHERETYDLVGITYDGHPNLQRILMPVDWLGHPLRKDYKVDDPRLVWNER